MKIRVYCKVVGYNFLLRSLSCISNGTSDGANIIDQPILNNQSKVNRGGPNNEVDVGKA